MRFFHRLAPIACGLALVSCAEVAPVARTDGPSRALATLEPEDSRPWESWQPEAPGESAFLASWVAFDALQIEDPEAVEAVWACVYATLDTVRAHTSDDRARQTVQTLMALLEPGPSVSIALFFVAHKRGVESEGVVVEIQRVDIAAKPSATILLERQRGDDAIRTLSGVLDSGFAEGVDFEFEVMRESGEVRMVGDNSRKKSVDTVTTNILLSAYYNAFWPVYTGAAYPDLAARMRPAKAPAGMATRRRDIDEVLGDTLFTPRL